jgi:hypothetical protein
MTTTTSISTGSSGKLLLKKTLLVCGILSSLLYVAMNIFVPLQFPGYNSASQTISELSAIDAPTRSLWVAWGFAYTLLVLAFAWGVRKSAGDNRRLSIMGTLLIIYGALGIFWPLVPMHQREVLAAGGGTISDTMHIVFSILTSLLMLVAIGFGAAAFGKRFRFYSIITMIILLVFGAMTASEGSRLEANLPTPFLGVWERILIGAFLLWIVVLAGALLQMGEKRSHATTRLDKENIKEKRQEKEPQLH